MNKKIILLLLFCLLIPASIYASLDATVIHKVTGHRKVVQIGDPDAFTGGYILETPEIKAKYNVEDGDIAGAVKGFRPSGFSTTLASFLSEGGNESTLTVSSLTLPDGTTLNDSYYGDLLILTVGEGDSEEKISVSTLDESTKTFTIIDRGHEYGRLATSSSNILAHYPGDIVFVSNDDHFLNQQYIDLDSDQTISGTLTYTNYPEIETYTAPTEDEQFAPKKYVDETAFAGVSNGTETVKGIWEGATREEMASSTVTGGSGANLILKSEYATSSPDVRGINVVVSENDGYIDQDWIDLDEDFTFTGDVTMATTSVSALTIGESKAVANKIVKSYIAGEDITERDFCMLKEITEEYNSGTDDKAIANVSGVTYVSQGFQVPTAIKLFKGKIYAKKNQTPSANLKISIYSDSEGSPDTSLSSVEIDKNLISSSYAEITFIIEDGLSLEANTQYHLVFSNADNSVDASDYYILESNTTGAYNYGKTQDSSDGSNWSEDGSRDLRFKIYYNGVMKADNDDENVNTGVGIIVADENVTTRTLGTFILKGEKDGYNFNLYNASSGNIYSQTSAQSNGACDGSDTSPCIQTFVNTGNYTLLESISIYLFRESSFDGNFILNLYRTQSGGDPTGGSLCSISGSYSEMTTSYYGQAYTMYCNVLIEPGEHLALSLTASGASTGYVRMAGLNTSRYSTGNNMDHGAWQNSQAKMTVVASQAIDYSIGKFLYAGTTPGEYAKTGKYIAGMIIDQDTLLVGKKTGMEYLGFEEIKEPGNDYDYGNRNWAKVPPDAETVLIYATLNADILHSRNTVLLTRSGLTSAVLRDTAEYSIERYIQASFGWNTSANYISYSAASSRSSEEIDTIKLYFYK